MRPIRCLSRKNSVQKPQIDSQSRLMSQFSKLNSKILPHDKSFTLNSSNASGTQQSSSLSAWNLLQAMNNLESNNKSQSKKKACSSSETPLQSVESKFHRIGLSSEQLLQEKQTIIQHLRLELQQSRYIIVTLKQQNKELTSQVQQFRMRLQKEERNVKVQKNNEKLNYSQGKCHGCAQLNSLKGEVQFLRNKEEKDKEFTEMYEGLIQRLTEKIALLQSDNQKLRLKESEHIRIEGKEVKQNCQLQNYFKSKSINKDATLALKQNNFVLNRDITSNQKSSQLQHASVIVLKENHPSTPKNNLPLSLQKKKPPIDFSSIQKHIDNTQISSGFLGLNSQIKGSQQSSQLSQMSDIKKKKISSSPYKLKEKLMMGKQNRFNGGIKHNRVDSSNCTQFYANEGLRKLDKKIYF